MHLRLVKGAYWDYEIKNSQVLSHIDYSVYTKKSITELIDELIGAYQYLDHKDDLYWFYSKTNRWNNGHLGSIF